MGTKTCFPYHQHALHLPCEKRIPKHGDENLNHNSPYNIKVESREKRIPKHGDENTIPISTLKKDTPCEKRIPKHGDENFLILFPSFL